LRFHFWDSDYLQSMILLPHRRESDATEEARDKAICSERGWTRSSSSSTSWRSSPEDRLGRDRPRDRAALQRQGAAWDSGAVCDRTVAAQANYGLSDEGACDRWVYDPYFQFFTGEEFFQHEFPYERSDLSHWRKRLGDRLELLLARACGWQRGVPEQGPGAGHGRHQGAGHHLPDRRQAAVIHLTSQQKTPDRSGAFVLSYGVHHRKIAGSSPATTRLAINTCSDPT
jgi:hypothetical protein